MYYYDGGAFADCPFIQFPHGMGKQRAPAMVVAAAAAAAASVSKPFSSSSASSSTGALTASAQTLSNMKPTLPSTAAAVEALSARALALVPSAATTQLEAAAAPSVPRRQTETAEETTARTAQSIQASLHATQKTAEVFDGRSLALQSRQRAATNKPSAASNALTIVVGGGAGDGDTTGTGAKTSDPGPIERSPTKEKKSRFTDALLLHSENEGNRHSVSMSEGTSSLQASSSIARVTGGAGDRSSNAAGTTSNSRSRKVVVPFCVSSWQNRKKLIVPVEQRLAQQQHDDRLDGDTGMGDAIVDLAVAMQQASREVAAEMAAKEKAKAEEEERRQAALEAAEAEKARQLLEQKAAELAANAQRRETREQRLERIRLERELREREKLAKQEQRLRERAAARLNISVEDLEADEQLLRTVEEASVHVSAVPSASAALQGGKSGLQQQLSSSLQGVGKEEKGEEDDEDETTGSRRKAAVRGGVFASAVISNEGIKREMEALAAVEAQQQQEQRANMNAPLHDGIRLRDDDENSADEDRDDADGDFQLQNFVKKKQRL